jgi:HSP20 family protein
MALTHHNNNSNENEHSLVPFDSFFNDFENEFFNHQLIPRHHKHHPFHLRHSHHHHYDPFDSMKKQMVKAFDQDVFKMVDFCPKINISEDENKYYIHADLPGMTKEEVKMEISDDRIFTLSGERKSLKDNNQKKEKKNKKFSKIECSYGKFERSFTLPENADINNIQAKMENGVLEVTINKIEPEKNHVRTIEIQ